MKGNAAIHRLTTSLLLALLPSGCQRHTAAPSAAKPEPPAEVRTTHPFVGEITRHVSLPGQILPNQQATLYAKVAGYLQKITVDKGDAVKQGDVIATIEAPELLADLAKFKADLEVAEIEFQRTAKAQEKAPDLVVRQSVDAAKAKYLSAKASLERAETLLGFMRVAAPFSGVVTRRFVDPGAFIPAATSGSAAQTAAVVTLMDFAVVRVQVAVPEYEVALVQNGLPVQLLVEGLPGRTWHGTITRYSHFLDETKTMLAEIDVPNPKGELLPGMYATVKIGIEKKQDALLLPVTALVMEKANAFAFTVVDHKARKTPIKIGFSDGTNVEITSGLKPADQAILLEKRAFVDGQPVSVREGK
ncbi:MAG: efflux RND transporter periplasmic adaptor subunit [Verrucomicrobiales bacterium]|nr:efflux RND transporter periplasmic adaptor subunit [Verrucomicrobiales bacterium]